MLTTAQRASFARAIEPLLIETPINRYLRISDAKHRDDALGMGPGSTRFSPTDTRSADKHRSFLVLYLAENLATALYETVVRHGLDYETSRVLTPRVPSPHRLALGRGSTNGLGRNRRRCPPVDRPRRTHEGAAVTTGAAQPPSSRPPRRSGRIPGERARLAFGHRTTDERRQPVQARKRTRHTKLVVHARHINSACCFI